MERRWERWVWGLLVVEKYLQIRSSCVVPCGHDGESLKCEAGFTCWEEEKETWLASQQSVQCLWACLWGCGDSFPYYSVPTCSLIRNPVRWSKLSSPSTWRSPTNISFIYLKLLLTLLWFRMNNFNSIRIFYSYIFFF